MKKIAFVAIVIICMLILTFQCVAVEENYCAKLFKKDNITDIFIEISEENLADMDEYAINKEYHRADVTIGDVRIEGVGIRTKGSSTLEGAKRASSCRYSFRVKFDKYKKGQTFFGLDELCLNNCYGDPSYMREYLHYEILEDMGFKVPGRTYCNVYINGELLGFYLGIEGIDESFAKRVFGEDYEKGNLYKMESGADLKYEEKQEYEYAEHKIGDDKELKKFKSFVEKLNDPNSDMETFLDVEGVLKYVASNTVLCNYDSYNGSLNHNFYLYENENGVFTIIPWDFNMSFGGFGGDSTQVGIDTPVIGNRVEDLPLIKRLLENEAYREKYYGYIRDLMTDLEGFNERVFQLKDMIRECVKNDPTAFYSMGDFEKVTTDTFKIPYKDRARNESGDNSIIRCISARVENLKAQFEGRSAKDTEKETYRPTLKQKSYFDEKMKGVEKIRIHVNGNVVVCENEPFIKKGTTLVLGGAVATSLGACITYDNGAVILEKGGTKVKMIPESTAAYVNGKEKMLLTPMENVNGDVYIPLRFVAEAFDMKVKWHNDTKLVEICAK